MKLNAFVKNIYGSHFHVHTTLMFMLAFGTACMQFVVTYCLGLIIDAVSGGYDATMHYFSIIVSSLLIFIVCSSLQTFFCGKMTVRLSFCLRSTISEKLCSARYEEIEQIKDGELLTIATKDVEDVRNWFEILLKLGCLPAQLGLVLIFAFRLNWKFSLITLCLIPLAAVPEAFIAKGLGRLHAKEKQAYAGVLSFFTATMELLLVIKSFRLEKLFQEKNRLKLGSHKKARMKRLLREQLVDVYGRCFGHITNPLMLLLGAYFILAGELSLGMLTSVILLAGFVGEGLKVLNEVPARLHDGRASAAHMAILLRLSDEQNCGNVPGDSRLCENVPVYEVQSLNFTYGIKTILHDVAFKVSAGEKIAIVGPSGCGKTTLFKLLSGLYVPAQGQIFFRGKDVALLSPDDIRKRTAVMTQEAFLFHGSFKDNIRITDPGCSDAAVAAASKRAQIDSFIESFENGYDTVVNTAVQSISNGQMQRINLARAFLKDADIFLLDEPTSALDPETAGLVLDGIFSSCADKTLLMILHNVQEIYRFDKVLMMDDGRAVGFGTHQELMDVCEPYRHLYLQGTGGEVGKTCRH